MSLITRCPACATMFKVVPDQLRISAGWVRCGVCGEIFDAMPQMLPEAESLGLESLGPDSAPAPGAEAPSYAATLRSASGSTPDKTPVSDDSSDNEDDGWVEASDHALDEEHGLQGAAGDEGRAVDVQVAAGLDGQDAEPAITPAVERALLARSLTAPESDDADAVARTEVGLNAAAAEETSRKGADPASHTDKQWMPPAYLQSAIEHAENLPEPALLEGESRQELSEQVPSSITADQEFPEVQDTTTKSWWPRAESADQTPAAAEAVLSPEPIPSFVKQARRRAFLRSRGVRVALWLAVIVFALGLGLQWAIIQRDWLAAREPRLTPFLESLCRPVGCVISSYRDLNAIVIDGSSFQRVASDSFRLNVSLRNNGDLPVAPPSIELILTDGQDQVLLRRVVTADEMSAPRTLNAHGEFNGSSAVSVEASDPSAIVGYRLTAFYP